jgi:hypothetical protein
MWFRNKYRHEECGASWEDEYSCICNDKCPSCNAEIEPEESDDLTVRVMENEEDDRYYGRWGVYLSPESAEYDPDYVRVKSFGRQADAETYAEEMRSFL